MRNDQQKTNEDVVYVLVNAVAGYQGATVNTILGVYESEELAVAEDAKLPEARTRYIDKHVIQRAPVCTPYYVVIDRWGNVFMACADGQDPYPANVGEAYRAGAWHEVVYGTVDAYTVEEAVATMQQTREQLLMSGEWWRLLAEYRREST